MAAKGEPLETATTWKPWGMAVILSPWLIQTGSLWPTPPKPASSGLSATISMSARPNSPLCPASTWPPSWLHMVISP